MRVRGAVLGLAMLGLIGCGEPTSYRPAADGYGYSEQQIETNRYRVTFAGNELTEPHTVQNYLLYRAAEITLDRGYDYFTVVDRNLVFPVRIAKFVEGFFLVSKEDVSAFSVFLACFPGDSKRALNT